MPIQPFDPSRGPLEVFLSMMAGSLPLYFGLASLSYLLIFVWMRRRFHPGYRPNLRENLRAIYWSQLSILGNVLLSVPIHLLIAQGKSRVYFDVAERGWPYLVGSAVLVLVVAETMIYWVHRGLHWGPFYRWFHRHHHSFREPTSWVSVAFHPVDSFAQAAVYHLCAFLFPLHVAVYLLSTVLATVWSTLIHDRISFLSDGIINHTAHHSMHHWYNNYNFGQYFTVWDRIGGTYRSPKTMKVPSHTFVGGGGKEINPPAEA